MKSGELSEAKISTPKSAMTRGLSIMDFILRLIALVGTIGSAISMGTTKESLPFFTQFVRFRAEYTDLPTFSFFVVANAIASAYLVLSLPLSFFHIIRGTAGGSRLVLLIFDLVMLSLLTSGSSAAAAIVYLAHNGNAKANWFSFCQQFNSFCERISGALIGSFVGISLLVLMILLSAVALSRR